jgi:hypothetical protein
MQLAEMKRRGIELDDPPYRGGRYMQPATLLAQLAVGITQGMLGTGYGTSLGSGLQMWSA